MSLVAQGLRVGLGKRLQPVVLGVVGAALLATAGGAAARADAALDDPDMTDTDRRARERDRAKEPERPSQAATPSTPASKASEPQRSGEAATSERAGWCIAIALFREQEQLQDAQTMLARVRSEGGLPDARLERRGQAVLIAVGNFDDADDQKARDDLKRVQQIEINGKRPYLAAYLSPPPAASLAGKLPQYNLTRAKAMLGESALYTLQVAAYGREDLAKPSEAELSDARKAAEQAVVQLRQDGEQAFYYHGPRMSMVTVGVFDITDYDPQVPSVKSGRLRDAEKRHPHNLYNGAAIKERAKGRPERLQPSHLVAIPTK